MYMSAQTVAAEDIVRKIIPKIRTPDNFDGQRFNIFSTEFLRKGR
jgi:hypothetical protein